MNFRGKQWERNGNRYHLVNTNAYVIQWNSGANATFAVEFIGISINQQNYFPIKGKGQDARDNAISLAIKNASEK